MLNKRRVILLTLTAICLSSSALWAKSHRNSPTTGQHAPAESTLSLDGAVATVAFAPNGDATNVIVRAINGAKKQVLVQAYGFTSLPIIKALGDAKARGLDVEAILDKSNKSSRYSGATYLSNLDIPVWIDDSVAIAHNKVMVIDGDSVITGSFNFTQAAQDRNAENVLLIAHAPALAKDYAKDWMWRKGLSHPYH